MSRERRVQAWMVGIAAAGLVLGGAPLIAVWPELPEPLATHFALSGAANGKMTRTSFALLTAAQPLLVALMALPMARRGADGSSSGAPLRLAVAGFLSALAASMSWLVTAINLGHASWSDVRMDVRLLVLALLFTFVVAGGLAAVARRLWPLKSPAPVAPTEVMALEVGERAYWSGRASSRWFWAVALALASHAIALHALLPGSSALIISAAMAFALVLSEHLSFIRVTIDERAVTIHYGRLGWIRQSIGIGRVASAASFEHDPWQHGGWGYRGSLKLNRRAAVVVRGGLALRLELTDGSQLTVTVDDAATAARLLNGFVQRRSSAAPTPSTPLAPLGTTP